MTIQRTSRAAHIPSDATLRKWAAASGVKGAVTVRYVGAAEGRKLNRAFRKKDYATNVLSFPYSAKPVEGDIVICAPVVAREAREQGKGLRAHHAHMLVHGLLHLAGYDHESDNGGMAKRERELRRELGLPGSLIQRESRRTGRGRGGEPPVRSGAAKRRSSRSAR